MSLYAYENGFGHKCKFHLSREDEVIHRDNTVNFCWNKTVEREIATCHQMLGVWFHQRQLKPPSPPIDVWGSWQPSACRSGQSISCRQGLESNSAMMFRIYFTRVYSCVLGSSKKPKHHHKKTKQKIPPPKTTNKTPNQAKPTQHKKSHKTPLTHPAPEKSNQKKTRAQCFLFISSNFNAGVLHYNLLSIKMCI